VDYLVKPFEFERFSRALTAYRDGVVFMRNQPVFNQTELDQRILHKELAQKPHIPKGLDRNTLKTICQALEEIQHDAFTTEEMANRIGISRVSMRKYLNFLRQLEVLELEVTYGSVGRPLYKYRSIGVPGYELKQYL
jgi:CitB family two-component system response regulator MalR